MESAVAEALALWNVTDTASPGVARPHTWTGTFRWMTMWSLNRAGSATSAQAFKHASSAKTSRNGLFISKIYRIPKSCVWSSDGNAFKGNLYRHADKAAPLSASPYLFIAQPDRSIRIGFAFCQLEVALR